MCVCVSSPFAVFINLRRFCGANSVAFYFTFATSGNEIWYAMKGVEWLIHCFIVIL